MARVPEFVKEQIRKKIGDLRQEARDLESYIQGSGPGKKIGAGKGKGKKVMSDEAKAKISAARKASEAKKKAEKEKASGKSALPLISDKAKAAAAEPAMSLASST